MSKGSYTSTQLLRSSLREPQGGEKASAEHQIKVRQSLGAQIFSHQATSGIMRGLSLMCESRVCPLCEANEGKHVRKGWLYTWYVRTCFEWHCRGVSRSARLGSIWEGAGIRDDWGRVQAVVYAGSFRHDAYRATFLSEEGIFAGDSWISPTCAKDTIFHTHVVCFIF